MTLPVVAEVVRSGFVESRHHGSCVVLAVDGATAWRRGEVDRPVLPRSCMKPLQLTGLLRAGLAQRDPAALAVAAASHNGQDVHVAAVRRLLADAGLGPDDLDNAAGLPLHEPTARSVLCAGGGPDRLRQNCSGKHAAMLATCVARGWATAGYRDPQHPVQQAVRVAVEELTGEVVAAVAVDGCGAPLFAVSLTGLARAFARLVSAHPGTPERTVADAMRDRPDLVGGPGRDVTALMAGLPGLLAKDGAEGCYAAAMPGGPAVALKVDDGAARARTPVLVAALRAGGLTGPVLDRHATGPVFGHGEVVGEVRAAVEHTGPRP